MIFGIRPEHITERKAHSEPFQLDFESAVQVLEPMGMDTMVLIDMDGTEVSARSAPRSVGAVGQNMAFTIDMNNMHLVDPASDKVV